MSNTGKKHFRAATLCGGGARAVSPLPGFILACEQVGFEPEVVVGMSGAFLATILKRAGYKGPFIARLTTETPFISLLTRKASIWGLIKAELFRRIYEHNPPRHGAFGSHRFGIFFSRMVPKMPKGCVTLAVAAKESTNMPILFTDKAVHRGKFNDEGKFIGAYELISNSAAPVDVIVRSVPAIPGVLESITWDTPEQDKQFILYDGGIGPEGHCVISPLLSLYGMERETIVAFDVGEDKPNLLTWLQDRVYKFFCDECYFPRSPEQQIEGITVVSPKIRGISSLQFKVGEYLKLWAILTGYDATMQVFHDAGWETPSTWKLVMAEASALHQKTRWERKLDQFFQRFGLRLPFFTYVKRMKELLARHGMYELGPSEAWSRAQDILGDVNSGRYDSEYA